MKAPGRPRCTAFNLAHSAQYGLLALTRDRDVGLDIEIERDLTDLTGMARQIMSPTEFQCFESTAAHLAGEAFFGLWTRKEALLKATGAGFSTDPRELHLGLENREATVALRGGIWSVASLEGLLPLKATIAVSGGLPAVRIFHSADARLTGPVMNCNNCSDLVPRVPLRLFNEACNKFQQLQ